MNVYTVLNGNNSQRWSQFQINWLLFGLLLSASWYWHPLFSLVCFVPYFKVLFRAKKNLVYYVQLFVLNLTWNAAITYWICQLKLLKGLGTLFTNSMLFLLPVLIWHLLIHRGFLKKGQVLFLLMCWILFEYTHHVWDFSWTWLTVGNVFGSAPQWVLWYAYVGVLGGSAWILGSNYFIYEAVRSPGRQVKKWFLATFAVLLPVVISLGISTLRSAQPAGTVSHIAAVALSMNDKDSISDVSKLSLIDSMLVASKAPREIVLLPEVLLAEHVWLDRFPHSIQYAMIKQSLKRWRTSHVISGAQLNVRDDDGAVNGSPMPEPGAADKSSAYNAALMIDTSDIVSIKLKKVLVPVEEYVPSYLSFLNLKTYGFSIAPGNPDIFEVNGRQYLIGICYEMVNSIFIASRIKQNTSALLMLSSESFFGPSEVGRKQYMNICRLRCLENNLPLVKSVNDGIVLSVDAMGDVLEAKRTVAPYLMHAAIRSSAVSIYHSVAACIPWFLLLVLGGVLMVNVLKKSRKLNCHRRFLRKQVSPL
jgi:apolipoprotein N-acyltransferase